jgi:hypothetical protein
VATGTIRTLRHEPAPLDLVESLSARHALCRVEAEAMLLDLLVHFQPARPLALSGTANGSHAQPKP